MGTNVTPPRGGAWKRTIRLQANRAANVTIPLTELGASHWGGGKIDLVTCVTDWSCAVVLGLELAFQCEMREALSLIAFVILHFVLHVGSRSRAWIGMGLPS